MSRKLLQITASAATLACIAGASHAQSSINNTRKHAWTENCGWTNWHGAHGVRLHNSFLSGWIWSENLGWITVGDGTPTNGSAYANANGTDFGVNIIAGGGWGGGELEGLAWSENAGWVNFGPLASLANDQQARYEHAAKRFRGYAWSENIGWINLDDPTAFIGTCGADIDGNGGVTADDIFAFLDAWFAQNGQTDADLSADFDGNGGVTADDIFAFLDAWFAGCE